MTTKITYCFEMGCLAKATCYIHKPDRPDYKGQAVPRCKVHAETYAINGNLVIPIDMTPEEYVTLSDAKRENAVRTLERVAACETAINLHARYITNDLSSVKSQAYRIAAAVLSRQALANLGPIS